MKKSLILILLVAVAMLTTVSFRSSKDYDPYTIRYDQSITSLHQSFRALYQSISGATSFTVESIDSIRQQITLVRMDMKGADFWLRYLEPLADKKINGPLPVEWETEVFEKFEKPYRRDGAGLTLAELYLDEDDINKDTLLHLIKQAIDVMPAYTADSITNELKTYHHFYLCNRLFLLNLATIYTTSFECPNTENVIPELREMLQCVHRIYNAFNESFPDQSIYREYLQLYEKAMAFTIAEPDDLNLFNHYTFLRDYVNPLFQMNQKMILDYRVVSHSMVDYSLNKRANSIFSKELYSGQNVKGIFIRVENEKALIEIDRLGKLLFYDPVLSGNNERSCASCHHPTTYFTDTSVTTAIQYNKQNFLSRNTPTLLNAPYNHLVMMDGKHISLQNQTRAVISNPVEMGADEKEMLRKILSCKEYKEGFKKLLKYTPQEPEISFEHIASAITFYYSKFSKYTAPFDEAINGYVQLDAASQRGFNLFMSKAQCATCHFAPQFNGVKPPYVSSEFEVLGVPEDSSYKALSNDKGRFDVFEAPETFHAFRTNTIRNSMHTAPYMHNGVFKTMEQVIDFYDAGGGAGRGLSVRNQTLSADSLHLTTAEKKDLIAFIQSLDEKIIFENPPSKLPASKTALLNKRKTGGSY